MIVALLTIAPIRGRLAAKACSRLNSYFAQIPRRCHAHTRFRLAAVRLLKNTCSVKNCHVMTQCPPTNVAPCVLLNCLLTPTCLDRDRGGGGGAGSTEGFAAKDLGLRHGVQEGTFCSAHNYRPSAEGATGKDARSGQRRRGRAGLRILCRAPSPFQDFLSGQQ